MQFLSIALVACIAFILPAAVVQESEPRPQEVVVPQPERPEATTADGFSKAQLEQLVAPIALYPDALLSQVLMAATYPLEIVETARFAEANPELKDDALEQALQEHDWSPSVKALIGFPDVLQRMNENLDWTRDLGDAFLAQEAELMDTVQEMRQRAHEAGHLESTQEQEVEVRDDRIIEIVSRDPAVVYVPVYYPRVVYGGWGYPWWWYPSLYAPPPPHSPFLYFRPPFWWHVPLWGRCNWHWHRSRCDVDVDVHNRFVSRTFRDPRRFRIDDARSPRVEWRHDPRHRQGVTYRSPDVTRKFRPDVQVPRDRLDRDERGRVRPPRVPLEGQRPATPPRTAPRPPPRETQPQRPDSTPDRPEARPDRPPRPTTPPPTRRVDRPPERRDGALRGSRQPGFERAAQERGRRSLERSTRPRPSSPSRGTRPPPRPPAPTRRPGGNS